MRKILVILSSMIAVLLFLMVFISYSGKQDLQLDALFQPIEMAYDKDKKLEIYFVSYDEKETKQFMKELQALMVEKDITSEIHHAVTDSNSNNIINNYYYLTKANEDIFMDSLRNNFYLKDNNITFTDITSTSYITTGISENGNQLCLLNPIGIKTMNVTHNFKPIALLNNDIVGSDHNYLITMITDDPNGVFQTISDKAGTIFQSNYRMDKGELIAESSPSSETNKNVYVVLLIFIAACFLCMIGYIQKKGKEITIRFLNGHTMKSIFFWLYKDIFISNIVVFFVTLLCCYGIIVQRVTPDMYAFIKELVMYASWYFIITVLLQGIVFLYVRRKLTPLVLKKDSTKEAFIYANIILKVVLLVVVLMLMLPQFSVAKQKASLYFDLKENKDLYSSFYTVGNVDEHFDPEKKYSDILLANGAISCDFSLFTNLVSDADFANQTGIKYPYIKVNKNYMKQYELKDEHGKVLDMDALEYPTLLVPEKYKKENLAIYTMGLPTKTIYISGGNKFSDLSLTGNQVYAKDPIALVYEKKESNLAISPAFLFLPKTQSIEYYKGLISHIPADLVTISDYENRVDNILESFLLYPLLEAVGTLTFLLFVYGVFVYQMMVLYFAYHKKELSLQYMLGYSFWKRNMLAFIMSILSLLIPCCIVSVIKLEYLGLLLQIIVVLFLFEFLIEILMMKWFERRNMVTILKGDE